MGTGMTALFFTVFVPSLMCAIVGYMIGRASGTRAGEKSGEKKSREEAVREGVATWAADASGAPRIRWLGPGRGAGGGEGDEAREPDEA